MLRTSLAAAVMAMSFATSADAYISLNSTYSNIVTFNIAGFNGCQMQGVSLNGQSLAGQATDDVLVGAKDADPRSTTAEIAPLVVEAVVLPTGETMTLR
jgi:hypothetical protein